MDLNISKKQEKGNSLLTWPHFTISQYDGYRSRSIHNQPHSIKKCVDHEIMQKADSSIAQLTKAAYEFQDSLSSWLSWSINLVFTLTVSRYSSNNDIAMRDDSLMIMMMSLGMQ